MRRTKRELIGFVVGRRVTDFLEIDLPGVAPEKRRCGAGAPLLGELIASEHMAGRARGWNCGPRTLRLTLYAGLGFVVVGRRARYYPDGEDALLLTRAPSCREPALFMVSVAERADAPPQ